MSQDRRAFMGVALATGLTAQAGFAALAATPTEAELKGKSKAELPTPALLVDLDAFENNLKVVVEQCKRTGCGFRPHAKTHKCPEIARRQVAVGALGGCAATVPEAEALVAGGIRGVLLTSPIMEPHKIARMVALAKREEQVILAVGHPKQAELLSEAAEAAGITVNVLVDVDIGDRRTGIMPGAPALDLARAMAKSKHLRLRGLQAYAGHASHTVGFEQRVKTSQESMGKVIQTKDLLLKAGLEAGIVTGGSTGTYNIDSHIQGVTELQVGSYIFMDVDYRRIGGKSGAVYTDFIPSLTVLTTVVSATHADRVSCDAGTKSFSTDVTYKPEAKGREGLTYTRAGDEFGYISNEGGGTLPKLGERLEFLVPHCDPTVNLYDRIYAMRGDKVDSIWPIAARREFVTPV